MVVSISSLLKLSMSLPFLFVIAVSIFQKLCVGSCDLSHLLDYPNALDFIKGFWPHDIGHQLVRVFLPLDEKTAIQKKIVLLVKKGGAVIQRQKSSKKMSQKNVTLSRFHEILMKQAYFANKLIHNILFFFYSTFYPLFFFYYLLNWELGSPFLERCGSLYVFSYDVPIFFLWFFQYICKVNQWDGHKRKKTFLMNGYILDLVTCFDNRGFTKHYDTKVRQGNRSLTR